MLATYQASRPNLLSDNSRPMSTARLMLPYLSTKVRQHRASSPNVPVNTCRRIIIPQCILVFNLKSNNIFIFYTYIVFITLHYFDILFDVSTKKVFDFLLPKLTKSLHKQFLRMKKQQVFAYKLLRFHYFQIFYLLYKNNSLYV